MCDCTCHENYTLDTLIPKVGVITDIRTAVVNGNTVYYLMEENGVLYTADISVSKFLPFIKAGDTITVTAETETGKILSLK